MQNFGDIFDPGGFGAPGAGLNPVDWSWMLGGLYRPSLNNLNGGLLSPGGNPFGIGAQAGPQPIPPPGGVLAPPSNQMNLPPVPMQPPPMGPPPAMPPMGGMPQMPMLGGPTGNAGRRLGDPSPAQPGRQVVGKGAQNR